VSIEQQKLGFTLSDTRISEALKLIQEVGDLEAIRAMMDWDQQTGMPHGAGAVRGDQVATLQGLIHERWTDSRLGQLLQELAPIVQQPEYSDADRGLVRTSLRAYEQATKLPRAFVEELERGRVLAHEAWVKARRDNDFAGYAPVLERMIGYYREMADYYGYKDNRYDALLDIYEPGLTVQQVDELFEPVKEVSTSLLKRIQQSGKTVDTSFLTGEYGKDQQRDLCAVLLNNIGYDFERGWLAISAHPFTLSVGAPFDVRLTTRYDRYMPTSIMAALHEGGHGLYEQGTSPAFVRTPLANGASLGVHESQSRLWENAIGRSAAFWQAQYHHVQEAFPAFRDIDVKTFVRALNNVESSLIRVEADEVTYNLHIVIRYELEKALINGELSVNELPQAWNDKYRSYLGIVPDSDANGVLQDVHWTFGMGYFPTYTLGNVYGAQIYATLRREFPDFDARVAGGDTSFVLNWLRDHLYVHGVTYLPRDLIERVTGEAPNTEYFKKYITEKVNKVYGF